MFRIRRAKAKTLAAEGWTDNIIRFHRENLGPAQQAGLTFDVETGKKNCGEGQETLILAFDRENNLAGYLEYCPRDGGEVYITSVLVAKKYRRSTLFALLVQEAAEDLSRPDFATISCHVPRNNGAALEICRKLGFTLSGVKGNERLLLASVPVKELNGGLPARLRKRRLTLVEPSAGLKEAFLAMAADFALSGEDAYSGFLRGQSCFEGDLSAVRAHAWGECLPGGYMPAKVFWLTRGERSVIGVSYLRHRLTPSLVREGGHIGYHVAPSKRNKGYGTVLLALTLDKAWQAGLKRVMITCDRNNLPSARVIEKNGGVLLREDKKVRGRDILRYWIGLG